MQMAELTGPPELVPVLRPDYHRFSLRALSRYYRGEFAASTAVNIAYRGQIVIWVVTTVIQPLVLIPVWKSAAGPTGEIGGYTPGLFVTYFAVQTLVSHLTFHWLMWEFEFRIREGTFSPLLMRPIHPVHKDVCDVVSYKVVGLAGIIPGIVLLVAVYGGDLSGFTLARVALFVPAVLAASALRFVLEWVLALAAFWLTKVSALNNLYSSVGFFLGGSFAPLAVLPPVVQHVAFWSPFPWTVAFPVEVVMGVRTGSDIAVGFAMQAGWIVVTLVLLGLIWRRALRRYSAVGA